MSMDDVYNTMNVFEQELESFNDKLKLSFNDLHKNHEVVSPLWDDSMRKEYDSKWLSIEEKMNQYITVDGGNYIEVLIEKLEAIKGYLYGA